MPGIICPSGPGVINPPTKLAPATPNPILEGVDKAAYFEPIPERKLPPPPPAEATAASFAADGAYCIAMLVLAPAVPAPAPAKPPAPA